MIALRLGRSLSSPAVFRPAFARSAANLAPSIPKSEIFPKDPTGDRVIKASAASGVPDHVTQRSVRIFRPTKNAMQSGKANSKSWRIEWETQDRWENPLMGWISSADPMQATRVVFETKEEAVDFAKRQGLAYWIDEPTAKDFHPKMYADNFRYEPSHLRIIRTK